MANTPTISLRLPKDARDRLDRVAANCRRSRSYIIQEALERHLDEIEREGARASKKEHLGTIINLAGAGAALNGPRSKEEIDAHIRWLRGDD